MQGYIFQRSLQYLNKRFSIATSNVVTRGICFHKKPLSTLNHSFRSYSSNNISNKKTYITHIDELIRFIKDNKTFYLKLLNNIHDTVDYSKISTDDAQLLLNCCGDSLNDSSRKSRNDACQKVFKELLETNNLNLNIYHTYIEVCTNNSIQLNIREFLSNLKHEPTQQTYKLLLKNISEHGDVQQVYNILEIMKSKAMQLDEVIFNDVVLAHTINGGLKSSESVLETMKIAQISETSNTEFAIFKGIIKRGDRKDLEMFLQQFKLKLNEVQLLNIILELGLSDNISWLPEISSLYSGLPLSRDFMILLQQKCVHLVHMNKADAAWDIFQYFIKPMDETQDDYGFFILREMLFCQIDIDKIINFAKYLKELQLNNLVLEKLIDISLRHKFVNEAWKLLESLPELRAHFFWPLLVEAYNHHGEGGVFKTISKMKNLGVKADSETLRNFVLPFCNLDDTKSLMNKLKTEGFTVRETLEPLLVVLLQDSKVSQAVELLNNYNVDNFGKEWIKYLHFSWNLTRDVQNVVILLQKCCESNSMNSNNIIGAFLIKTLRFCKEPNDFIDYMTLLETIKDSRLKIDASTASNLRNSISNNEQNQKICDKIDALMDFGIKSELSSNYIPHPRDMNLDELECHLVELKEKKMNTRAVLRLLIMRHLNYGNLDRVKELKEEFLNERYEETTGMKSSLMHSFIIKGHLDPALDLYKEISLLYPNFKIDIFKIIDLCTLLVKENKYQMAMEFLQNESKTRKIKPVKETLRNCLELLNAFKNDAEQTEMFEFLINAGYCSISNVTLGPLIRIHLCNKNFEKAVNSYIDFTKLYKSTPLQLELFKEIVKLEDESNVKKLVNSTKKIHGTIPTQVTLIAAFAENGMEKQLQKFLLTLKNSIQKNMEKRCDRWVVEQKVEPLQNLLYSFTKLRLSSNVFDYTYSIKCIMKIYSTNNDCESAIKFYQFCQNNEIFDKELEEQLQKLLKKNKHRVNMSVQV